MRELVEQLRPCFGQDLSWPLINDARLSLGDREPEDSLHDFWLDAVMFRDVSRVPAIPPHNPFDPVERAVVLGRIYRAIDYIPDDDGGKEATSTLVKLLQEAIELRPIECIEQRRDLEWEITNAGAAGLWQRGTALCDRLLGISAHDPAGVLHVKGLLAFDAASVRAYGDPGDYWSHGKGAGLSGFSDLLRMAFAVAVAGPTSEESLEWAIAAAASFQQLQRLRALDAMNLACFAWCQRISSQDSPNRSELLAMAGASYCTSAEAQADERGGLTSALYTAAYDCYLAADRFSDTRDVLERWKTKTGGSGEIDERRARIEYEQGNYPLAFELLEKAVAEPGRGHRDERLRLGLLLKLGEFRLGESATRKALREVLQHQPELRETTAGVVTQYWPDFVRLTSAAKTAWVDGTLAQASVAAAQLFGEGRFNAAGCLFGEAVSTELWARVFEPAMSAGIFKAPSGSDGVPVKLTLGVMCVALADATKRLPAHKAFEQRLSAKHPRLWNYAKTTRAQLHRFNDLRVKAAHPYSDTAHRLTVSECDEMRLLGQAILSATI